MTKEKLKKGDKMKAVHGYLHAYSICVRQVFQFMTNGKMSKTVTVNLAV